MFKWECVILDTDLWGEADTDLWGEADAITGRVAVDVWRRAVNEVTSLGGVNKVVL